MRAATHQAVSVTVICYSASEAQIQVSKRAPGMVDLATSNYTPGPEIDD